MASTQYVSLQFDRLSGGEQIRLLKLLPSEVADTVEARLVVIESARHHEYEALSYTWVSSAQIVRLNGQPHTCNPVLDNFKSGPRDIRQAHCPEDAAQESRARILPR